jgi:hypothetical protein
VSNATRGETPMKTNTKNKTIRPLKVSTAIRAGFIMDPNEHKNGI